VLRSDAVTLVCDSHDRLDREDRRFVEVELRNLRRDFPSVQMFILTRPGISVSVDLPVLRLDELDPLQRSEFAKQHAAQTGADSSRSLYWLTPLLQRFAVHPFMLRLILDECAVSGKAPSNLYNLLTAWLERLLCTNEIDIATAASRERALRLVAIVTQDVPVARVTAADIIHNNGLPEGILDDLLRCGALAAAGSRLELTHEILGDYLRATDIVERIKKESATLDSIKFKEGSLLPAILASMLPSRQLQSQLWNAACDSGLQDYLNALHYRADGSTELERLSGLEASRLFLLDVLDGVEMPLRAHFPQLHAIVIGALSRWLGDSLAVVGQLGDDLGTLDYCYVAGNVDHPRVVVGQPPPEVGHFRNLNLAGFRPDSGRLVGASDLRDTLKRLVENQRILGGTMWRHERVIGWLRLIDYCTDIPICGLPITEIIQALTPLEGEVFTERYGSSRRWPVIVAEVLHELAFLEHCGVKELDLWWRRTDLERLDSTGVLQHLRCIPEHYRRVQLVYREVVANSFGPISSQLPHFSMLPLKYDLTIIPGTREPRVHTSIYYDWNPVADWEDAGATVRAANERPRIGWFERRDELRDKFITLGRSEANIGGPVFSAPPDYSGYNYHATFDGVTSVVTEVTEMLLEDLRSLFESLRTT